jgi:hypothetical protein
MVRKSDKTDFGLLMNVVEAVSFFMLFVSGSN